MNHEELSVKSNPRSHRFEEEVAQGLHKKKDVVKNYEQKGESVPEGTVFSDGKSTKSKTTTKKPKDVDFGLFGGEE